MESPDFTHVAAWKRLEVFWCYSLLPLKRSFVEQRGRFIRKNNAFIGSGTRLRELLISQKVAMGVLKYLTRVQIAARCNPLSDGCML